MTFPMQSRSEASSSGELPVVRAESASARDIRLRKHADYQRVYKASRKQFSNSMSWFVAARADCANSSETPNATPRVGITAGKVLGKAHERNRIKRRLREMIRRNLHELPAGVDLILHPKRSVMTMDFVKLEAEVVRIFRQARSQGARGPVLVPSQAARSSQPSLPHIAP